MRDKVPERDVVALRPAEGDKAAHDSNAFESCGREATWFPKGKPTSQRENTRRDE